MKEIAKDLLDIKAVFLSPSKPFTWASGIQSPIYCDNRLTLSYPVIRKKIEQEMAKIIKETYSQVEILMGTSIAGIPHAAYISALLDLPMGYVRSRAKSHGRENQIEGKYEKGQKVVVIEDLISTGGSSIEVVKTLEEAGLIVIGVVAIFSYNLEVAKVNFEKIKCPVSVLTNYDELLEVAVSFNYIDHVAKEKLLKWKLNPHDESWIKD